MCLTPSLRPPHQTLVWMLDNDIGEMGLDLTFTAEADEFAKHLFGPDHPKAKIQELCPNGESKEVGWVFGCVGVCAVSLSLLLCACLTLSLSLHDR